MDSPSQDASARKRNHFQDDPVPTPPTLKKRRLDGLAQGSPSTPKALDAINSAYPSTISSQNAWPPVNNNLEAPNSNTQPAAQPPQPPPPPPPAASAGPKFRPAIKLSA
ncbi:origin recognition complex subunit 4, partial [Fusarium napiforme]